jgi:ribosomal protein L24E
LKAPIIAMAATTTGNGYWLLGSDGGVFTFGDARYKGSTGAMRLGAPIISMAAAPSGAGYWLVARDGGVFSFGVPFYGSAPGMGLCTTPSGMQIRPTYSGHGYYVVAANGRVLTFGDAKGFGNAPGLGRSLANIAVDLTLRKF